MLTRGFSQLYVSLGDQQADGALAVRIYHKPLVLLIWLGAGADGLGGALSLSRSPAARRRAEACAKHASRCSRRSRLMRCGISFSSLR